MLKVYCLDINTKNNIKLPKNIVLHINKYKNKEFRKISKLGWSTLIDLLTNEGINFKNDSILFSSNNKPYLKSKKLYFSLSHSLNLIAIAISNRNVGIDIEKIIPDNISSMIANRILNKNQLKKYQNNNKYLTQIWTKKEAYAKFKDLSILQIEKLKHLSFKKIRTMQIKDSLNNCYYLSICR